MVSVLSRRFRRSNSRGSLPTGIGLAGWIEGYEPFPAAHALWRALRREPLIDSFLSVVEAVRDRVETAELCSDVDIGHAINLGSVTALHRQYRQAAKGCATRVSFCATL